MAEKRAGKGPKHRGAVLGNNSKRRGVGRTPAQKAGDKKRRKKK